MSGLLKWWKSRMISGYKQMAGDVCDTESERLTRCACSVTLTTTHRCTCSLYERQPLCSCNGTGKLVHRPVKGVPCLHTKDASSAQVCTKMQYSDLLDRSAVRGDESTSQKQQQLTNPSQRGAQPRSEFNFTLYDFDGHGTVTKDDIAGLVRAIYDVVGARVHVPHSGSKTINVKLTLCQENSTDETTQSPKHRRAKTDQRIPIPGFETITCSMDTDDVKLESKCHSTTSQKDGNSLPSKNHGLTAVSNQRRKNPSARHLAADSANTNCKTRSNDDEMGTHSVCRSEVRIPTPYSLPDNQRQDYELLNRCAQFSSNQNARNMHQQYRHRHRERENNRAMRHVIEWLEREHAQTKPQMSPTRERQTRCHGDALLEQNGGIEYRHLHEHVHHHYHHINSLTEAVVL